MAPTLPASHGALPPEGADFPGGGPAENRAKHAVQIIGVGNMGGAMAQNLLDKGWVVWVHDVDAAKVQFLEQKGGVAGVFTAQAAIKSIANAKYPSATIVCVIDAAQVQDVLFGGGALAQHLPRGHTVLLCPTIAPHDVQAVAQRLAEIGVHTLDAPMSGGPARALDASMSLMVAGPRAVYEAQHSLLAALSSRVFYVSERVGDGARTKLVNNLLAATNLVAAAEAMALARRMGLDLQTTLDVIANSSGQSWIGQDRMRRALAGDYAPRAHVSLLAKDSALALQAAQALGFDGPVGERAAQVFQAALAAGLAGEDDAAVYKFLTMGGPSAPQP
jgi:L-threonate 2-dehydrogenase